MKMLVALLIMGATSPALAQYTGHTMPAPATAPQPELDAAEVTPSPASAVSEETPMDHAAMDHGAMEAAGEPEEMDHAAMGHGTMDHAPVDHAAMNHSATDNAQPVQTVDHSAMNHRAVDAAVGDSKAMDHSQMDHSAMPHPPEAPPTAPVDHTAMGHGGTASPIPNAPPPTAAGSGRARAAEAIWGAAGMRASRAALIEETGSQKMFWFQGDRAELRMRQGEDGYLWDVQGYYGGDINKFWFKSEGEGSFGEEIESAEIQALWSRAIAPFFDFQAGIRQDLTGPSRTHAVVGIQGLVPYLFEVDAAAFLSNKGDLTATIEGELDQRITQRLILQPRAELALSAQDVPELGIGAGIDTVEAGVRLRYEFTREFAPYIGIDQEWKIGGSADYARLAGEDPSVTNYVVGVRFWF